MSIANDFVNGVLITENKLKNIAQVEWVAHPRFKGVNIKTLISEDESGGIIKSLLVKVDPKCSLSEHIHGEQHEMHEVIWGAGVATLENTSQEYRPGVMCIIPKGKKHSVLAGEEGLMLLAKFF